MSSESHKQPTKRRQIPRDYAERMIRFTLHYGGPSTIGASGGTGLGLALRPLAFGVLEEVSATGLEVLAASCQAGIDGRPTRLGREGEGEGGMEGPRLRSRALRDLSSCWSSARDCDWLSLFFSIIYNAML